MLKQSIAALCLATCAAMSAHAQDREIITEAPTADEYVTKLFAPHETTPGVQTRGLKTRGIVMPGQNSNHAAGTTGTSVGNIAAPAVTTASPTPASAPAPVQTAAADPKILAAPVNFPSNSASIPANFEPYLINLAEAMKRPEAADYVLNISGHTDSLGSAEYNTDLSSRRASSVRDFLVRQGVSPSQINSIGRGETQLIPGEELNHALNRRVEFKALPKAAQ